jgi:hypothetical protein
MVEIEFNYLQLKTIIQANLNDTFLNVLLKYKNKSEIDLDNKCFLYNGKIIEKNEIVKNILNTIDKENKKIIILVNDISSGTTITKMNLAKSKDIICPKCKEVCQFEIKDYEINLFGCKNGHIEKNIKLNKFNDSQYIDLSKIICGICKKKNKSQTYNNEFFRCYQCNINLCPLCSSTHDKTHSIINYDSKNYICNRHKEAFIKYCKNCQIDICLSCIKSHKNHELINYEDIMVDIDEIQHNIIQLKKTIDDFREKANETIKKLKKK